MNDKRSRPQAPLGSRCEVEGRSLWLHRSGEGAPAVVFLAGAGTVGLDYLLLQDRTTRLAASVIYDRGGTGWSDPAPARRSAAAIAWELRALLRVADVPPPYVLVGHSYGGLLARRYGQLWPEDVAGLVLLDPAHEDYDAYMPGAMRAARAGWISLLLGKASGTALGAAVRFAPGLVERAPPVRRYRELYRTLFAAEMADWPPLVREALVERHVSLRWLWAGIEEARTVEPLYREIRAGGGLPDVPLIIFCSTMIDEFRRAVAPGEPEEQQAEALAGQRRLYDDFAASTPRGEVRLVNCGHVTMPYRCADEIARAVEDVLAAVG